MFASRTPTQAARIKLGVGVLISDGYGRVLLERRSDCGLWGLPGGTVEPGESLAEAALREVFEETGLHVALDGLQGVYSEPNERIAIYPGNGDERHLVDVLVKANIVSGQLQASAESLELRFFGQNELPEDIVPPARRPLEDFFLGRQNILR